MTHFMYAIYDRATHHFGLPMCYETADAALRQLRVSAAMDETVKRCASDFALVCLGSYDSVSGLLCKFDPVYHYEFAQVLAVEDCNGYDWDTLRRSGWPVDCCEI